jgi:RNA polymerase sigma-70 factor (ECF subfamily)
MKPPDDSELRIRAALEQGAFEPAATLIFERYGEEILTFLAARLRSPTAAQEAFSMFAEDLWQGLPGFGMRCSARTWAYAIARNASARYAASPHNRPVNNMALSQNSALSMLVDRVRSATHIYQRTDVKSRMRELRDRLDQDDQMLLVLRVDRNMPWRDLAIAMSGNIELDRTALDREAARLRKAFERLKAELRKMAEAEGIIERAEQDQP